SWYVSSVLRVPTDEGYVYFKASPPPSGGREAALTRWLANLGVGNAPEVLATDNERGWTLTREMNGSSLHADPDNERWEETLREYARLQIATVGRTDDLLRIGCDDRRPERMVADLGGLIAECPRLQEGLTERMTEEELEDLQRMIPRLEALCAEVSGY